MGRTVDRVASTFASDPPGFVRLVAHPVRWGLLSQLARSDRAVRELTALVDKPQNLISYHLRRLRDGGLVTARRSSADGRDHYYSIDLDRCRDQLHAVGGALHPGLATGRAAPTPTGVRPATAPTRVLFLCTGNSARSQIAEALIEHISAGTVEAASAGSIPKPLHPNAVRVMARRGIDISARRTKHIDELAPQRFDHVITLCDRVREVCPEFPSHPNLVHWSLPNPADPERPDDATYPAFERTASELETRIGFLLASIAASHDASHDVSLDVSLDPSPPSPTSTEEALHADPAHR